MHNPTIFKYLINWIDEITGQNAKSKIIQPIIKTIKQNINI